MGLDVRDIIMGWAVKLLALAAIMAVGAWLWTYTPVIGPAAKAKAYQTALAKEALRTADWKRSALGWMAAANDCKGKRETEKTTAREAVNLEAKACTARVTEARRAAVSIRTLTRQEPKPDANGHPIVRMPADSLRNALQPAAGG